MDLDLLEVGLWPRAFWKFWKFGTYFISLGTYFIFVNAFCKGLIPERYSCLIGPKNAFCKGGRWNEVELSEIHSIMTIPF